MVKLLVIVFGSLLAMGAVKSDSGQTCTANDKLLDIIKTQQTALTNLYADSKKEADEMRKKYEMKLIELEGKGCKQ